MATKIILVGRHRLLPGQEQAIKRYLGTDYEAIRVPHVAEPLKDVIEKALFFGAKAVIVQGLPLPVMAELVMEAKKEGIPVLFLKMRGAGVVPNEETAKQWVAEDPDNRTYLPPTRTGEGYRLLEFDGLYLQHGVEIKEEKVV